MFQKIKKLPVKYVANRKAQITSDIFKQHVSKWSQLKDKNKKSTL
jgi:hypothetical protein